MPSQFEPRHLGCYDGVALEPRARVRDTRASTFGVTRWLHGVGSVLWIIDRFFATKLSARRQGRTIKLFAFIEGLCGLFILCLGLIALLWIAKSRLVAVAWDVL